MLINRTAYGGENERAAWIFSDNHLNFRGSTEGY